ncbi:hypothetical protein J4467_03060 [Candidatus Woesearchaeota archaeon]|nr:hypothetical protein [Candidatus Woesearchaeota archaeon]
MNKEINIYKYTTIALVALLVIGLIIGFLFFQSCSPMGGFNRGMNTPSGDFGSESFNLRQDFQQNSIPQEQVEETT